MGKAQSGQGLKWAGMAGLEVVGASRRQSVWWLVDMEKRIPSLKLLKSVVKIPVISLQLKSTAIYNSGDKVYS